MKVIHYTDKKDWSLKPIKITNPWKGDGLSIKPLGGIWCSPSNSKYSWKDWCKAESFGRGKYRVELDVDLTNFVIIDSVEDCLSRLIWVEPKNRINSCIDFEQMKSNGVTGIYLTDKGQAETRFMTPYSKSLYGWDCESLVILDEKAILSWKLCSYQRGRNLSKLQTSIGV